MSPTIVTATVIPWFQMTTYKLEVDSTAISISGIKFYSRAPSLIRLQFLEYCKKYTMTFADILHYNADNLCYVRYKLNTSE